MLNAVMAPELLIVAPIKCQAPGVIVPSELLLVFPYAVPAVVDDCSSHTPAVPDSTAIKQPLLLFSGRIQQQTVDPRSVLFAAEWISVVAPTVVGWSSAI
jgi:hypothetical protein